MRIVLDTNIVVSGVIAAGVPRRLMNAAKAEIFEWCTSEVLLAELLDVLSRDKFVARLQQAQLTPQAICDDLRRLATVVSPFAVPRVVVADVDDDQVLATALASKANLIASGDKRHLLPLGSYEGIEIVTARQASLSVILCARHSMTIRSMYAKQDEVEERGHCGQVGGVAVDPEGAD